MSAGAICVRPARREDLPRLWDIRHRNDIVGEPAPPAQGPLPPYLPHLLETADLRVAEREGRALGYAAAVERGGVVYVNDLFIEPESQSGGLGAALLRAVLPPSGAPRCVLASTDFRALALYARSGMAPAWPNFELAAESSTIALDRGPGEWVEADSADPDLIGWDASVSGRSRAVDLAYWRAREQGALLWRRVAGRTIGYAVVRFAAARTWRPDAAVVGPVGGRTPGDAARCLSAIVAWAAKQAPQVEVAVPGPHPGLTELLAGRLKIVYHETFACSDGRIVNPTVYVGSGGDLF